MLLGPKADIASAIGPPRATSGHHIDLKLQSGPDLTSGPPRNGQLPVGKSSLKPSFASCSRRYWNSLIVGQRNRPRIAFTLQLSGRILYISRHQFVDRIADRYHDPGSFSVVVHEDVVALLRVLPQVEDLRNGGDVDSAPFQPRLESTARPPVFAPSSPRRLKTAL